MESLRGTLIVSCQALPDEPLYGAYIMAKMAKACVLGGASAIRANGIDDILAIKQEVSVPIIGLIKRQYDDSEIYITPTKQEVVDLVNTGCEIIAIDATLRKRPNNEKLEELVNLIHKNNRIAIGDVSTIEEGLNAQKIGFDFVSTTLSGYTSYSKQSDEPDFELVEKLVKQLNIGVIAEGKISSISDMQKMKELNPFAIVIGSAITRPLLITQKYVNVLK